MKARSRLRPTAFSPAPPPVEKKSTPVPTGPARSRLNSAPVSQSHFSRPHVGPTLSPAHRRQLRKQSQQALTTLSEAAHTFLSWLLRASIQVAQHYAPYFLFLIASLPGYASTLYILFRVSPAQFQAGPLHDLYFFPQLLFFFSNYFLLSFLFQNYRRAIVVTVLVQLLVILRLQRFDISWWLPVVFLVLFGILELFWFVICKLRPTLSPTRKKKR